MPNQLLTLTLDGITASDYLTWVADPEPPALGNALGSITIDADPLDTTIHAALAWNIAPPPARQAAALAGLALTLEVAAVEHTTPVPKEPPENARPRPLTKPDNTPRASTKPLPRVPARRLAAAR